MSQSYEELLAEYKGHDMSPKSKDPEEIKRKRHEYYLKRKAEGKIKKPDPEKARANAKKYYERKKAELKAQGLSTYHFGNQANRKRYNPEQRAKYYQKWKAEGKTQKYYQEKKAADPLFNRKEHIKRKARDIEWQTRKGVAQSVSMWTTIVDFIKESELSKEELVQKLVNDWRLVKNQHTHKKDEQKVVYRPRITNTVLTEKQIEELDNFALTQGLTSQHELIKSTVSYYGEFKDIDHREEDKEVDVYSAQIVGKDYSEDEELHTYRESLHGENKGVIAQRERERESRSVRQKVGDKVLILWKTAENEIRRRDLL